MNETILLFLSNGITGLAGWFVGRKRQQADTDNQVLRNLEIAVGLYKNIIDDLKQEIHELNIKIQDLEKKVDELHAENNKLKKLLKTGSMEAWWLMGVETRLGCITVPMQKQIFQYLTRAQQVRGLLPIREKLVLTRAAATSTNAVNTDGLYRCFFVLKILSRLPSMNSRTCFPHGLDMILNGE